MSKRYEPCDPATWSQEGRDQVADVLRRALSRDGLRTNAEGEDMTTLNELYTAWSENSVLRGAVVTTEAEVVDGLERVTRVPTFEVYGDSKEEQIDGMSYERYWNEEGWGDTMLTSQLTREDGESCTPWMENEGGER